MLTVYDYDSEIQHHVAVTRLKRLGYDYSDEPSGNGTGHIVADDVYLDDDLGIRNEIAES